MKNNRLILLLVVGILLIVGTAVFTLTKNNVKAAQPFCSNCQELVDVSACGGSCPTCGNAIEHSYDENYECTICGATCTHEYEEWQKVDDSEHSRQCIHCGNVQTASHSVDNDSWSNNGEEGHIGTCADCNGSVSEAHTIDDTACPEVCTKCSFTQPSHNKEYVSNGDGTHTWTCVSTVIKVGCNDSDIEECVDGDDDGLCDYCGANICEHNYQISSEETVQATCTSEGTLVRICSKCGDREETTLPQLEHNIDADADEDGLCDYCGENICEHNYQTSLEDTIPATCTQTGTLVRICSKCGDREETTLPQLEHNLDEDDDGLCDNCGETIIQSCTHPNTKYAYGWAEHWLVCASCGVQVGTASSHDFNPEPIATKQPTCTEVGYYTYECETCGYTFDDTDGPIPATGHEDADNDGYCDRCDEPVSNTPSHTCTEASEPTSNGSSGHTYYCTQCQEPVRTEAHDIESYDTATCTTAGSKGIRCTECDYNSVQEVSPAKGHKDENNDGRCDICGETITQIDGHNGHSIEIQFYNNSLHGEYCNTCQVWLNNWEPHNPAATPDWTEQYHNIYCTGCGTILAMGQSHSLVTSDTNPCTQVCQLDGCGYTKANHSYTVFVENITVATCTTNGTARWKCAYCNETTVKTVTAAHKWQEFTKAATCTTAGSTGQECSVCKKQINVTTIAALGHNVTSWTNTNDGQHSGTCTRTGCGETVKEPHTYNSNNVCTKCGAVRNTECTHDYQIDASLSTQTHHYKKCTKCNDIISGTHTFTNGVCTICNYNCQHTYEDKQDETYHWKECSNCAHIADKEKHKYVNGECDCGKEDPNPTCEHDETEYRSDETNHWKVCKSCGKEIEGTKENHSFVDGTCKCGRKENQEQCKHTTTEWKMNNQEHWKVCKECLIEIENTRGNHSYVNGVCECGKKEDEKICEHKNREWKSNGDEHWQVCKDCGKEIDGTREKHVYVDGICKNCGIKDPTSSDNKLPNTGGKTIVIAVTALVALTIVGAIKVRKYRGI